MILGIIGDGQLALLLTKAFVKMQDEGRIEADDEIWVLSTLGDKCPAHAAGAKIYNGDYKNDADLAAFVQECDLVTPEITHFNSTLVKYLGTPYLSKMRPKPDAFILIQDKFALKEFLEDAAIPVAATVKVESLKSLPAVLEAFDDYPFMLKTAGAARDGKGVFKISNEQEFNNAINEAIRLELRDLFAEQWIDAKKELSVVVTVGDVETIYYPVTESTQKNNTCHITQTPAAIPQAVSSQAHTLAQSVVEAIDGGPGTYVIDFFWCADKLYVNGVTPRVDNSCHYTEACITPANPNPWHKTEAFTSSAYTEHIMAMFGLRLGKPLLPPGKHVLMLNILGKAEGEEGKRQADEFIAKAKELGCETSWYGKGVKVGRKIGHILIVKDSIEEARAILKQLDPEAYAMLLPLPELFAPAFAGQDRKSLLQLAPGANDQTHEEGQQPEPPQIARVPSPGRS